VLILLLAAFLQTSGPTGTIGLHLEALKNDPASARRLIAGHRTETLALLDHLRDTFDASIRSDRVRPEQRKIVYDRSTLETGIRVSRLYADVTGDRQPWRRFNARKLRIQGTELLNGRRYRDSLGKLNAALDEAERLDDVWLKVITELNLAYANIEIDELKPARRLCERATRDAQRLDTRAQALAAFDLAAVHLHLGHFAESIPYSDQAARFAHAVGIKIWEGNALMNLGAAHQQIGDLPRAHRAFDDALAVLQQTQDKLGLARTLYNLALVSAAEDNYVDAAHYLERALPMIVEVDVRHSHEIELNPAEYYNAVHESALRMLVDAYTRLDQRAKAAACETALNELLKKKPGGASSHHHPSY